tara:strand:- start:840 stop:1001 length:162 start_codon:yes stop_codon:yes gene_type:complete
MKTKEVMKILEENKLTNVEKKKEEERTHSEEMQDKLEPIPCPMHEDYDEGKDK